MFPYNSNHGVSSTFPRVFLSLSSLHLWQCPFPFGALVPWQKMKMKGTTCRPWLPGLLGIFFACKSPGWEDRKPWETCWNKLKSRFQRLKNLNTFRIILSVDGCSEVWDVKWESMTKPCRFCNWDAQKVQATHGTMVSMVEKISRPKLSILSNQPLALRVKQDITWKPKFSITGFDLDFLHWSLPIFPGRPKPLQLDLHRICKS